MPSILLCSSVLGGEPQRPGGAFRGLVEETIKGGGLNSGAVQHVLDKALAASASAVDAS